MLVKQRNVVGVGHGERMVGSHEALLLIAPFEEREVDNPQALEHILVAQAETVAHLQTKRAQLDARLVGVVTRENEHQVAIFGTGGLLDFLQLLGSIELVDRALHRSVALIFNIDKALGAHLRLLHEVGELVELLAAVVSAARYHDATDIVGLIEHREATGALEVVHQFDELHAEAQIGLV